MKYLFLSIVVFCSCLTNIQAQYSKVPLDTFVNPTDKPVTSEYGEYLMNFYNTGDMAGVFIDYKHFKFRNRIQFNYVTNLSQVSVKQSSVDSITTFHNSNFELVDISVDTFQSNVHLLTCKFNKGIRASEDIFTHKVDIIECEFNHNINFSKSRFSDLLAFKDVTFIDSANIYFNDAILPDTLVFYNVNTNGKIINLIDADFKLRMSDLPGSRQSYKTHFIEFKHTDISKFKLDYIHFKIPPINEDTPITEFERRLIKEDQIQVYEALLNNFKTNGQFESYEALDIEYQEFKWRHSWAKSLIWLPHWWWNWGYNKELIFTRTLWLLFLFTNITMTWLPYLNNKVYEMSNIKSDIEVNAGRTFFKQFLRRYWYAFVYTSSIFFRLTLKIENIKFEKVIGTIYLLIVYTTGLFCIAYMANFILQK